MEIRSSAPLDTEQDSILNEYKHDKLKIRPRQGFENLVPADKKMKVDLKEVLFKESKTIYQLMQTFKDNCASKNYPESIAIINKKWWDHWKKRV